MFRLALSRSSRLPYGLAQSHRLATTRTNTTTGWVSASTTTTILTTVATRAYSTAAAEPTSVGSTQQQCCDDDVELETDEVPLSELTPEERRFYFMKSWGKGLCVVCGEPVSDWLAHMNLPTHRARNLICRTACSPEKYSTMMTNLWHYLHFDAALIKEFDVKVDSTRRARLVDTIKFLWEHNVVLYSPYRFQEDRGHWVRTADFGKCLLMGESVVRSAVIDRLARLFPNATALELRSLSDVIMDEPAMGALYDLLEMNSLLPHPHRRKHKITQGMKRAMLLAMCGELNWFVAKSRATDRAFNNTLFPPSDALVIHVLSHHAVESVLLEVVHFYIQKVLRETLPVWNDHKGRLPYIAGKISWLVRPQRTFLRPLSRDDAPTVESANAISIPHLPGLRGESGRLAPLSTAISCKPMWRGLMREMLVRDPKKVSPHPKVMKVVHERDIVSELAARRQLPVLALPHITAEAAPV
eukprot:PhM_4_TR11843/c0_g1_i1/m.11817